MSNWSFNLTFDYKIFVLNLSQYPFSDKMWDDDMLIFCGRDRVILKNNLEQNVNGNQKAKLGLLQVNEEESAPTAHSLKWSVYRYHFADPTSITEPDTTNVILKL